MLRLLCIKNSLFSFISKKILELLSLLSKSDLSKHIFRCLNVGVKLLHTYMFYALFIGGHEYLSHFVTVASAYYVKMGWESVIIDML